MNKILIGIDPDVEAIGVSIITDGKMVIEKKSFFHLYGYLELLKLGFGFDYAYTVKVYIEAGWLNTKSNWHVSGKGENVASRIGTKVGANHQVGKLIAEMCEYLGLEYELVQPRTSKYSIKQFRMMSGYKGKLDQDMVDSALLIIGR